MKIRTSFRNVLWLTSFGYYDHHKNMGVKTKYENLFYGKGLEANTYDQKCIRPNDAFSALFWRM